MADPVTALPEESLELPTEPSSAGATAPAPARLPEPVSRRLGERARRFAPLHRPDVGGAGDGRPARCRRRSPGRQRPRSALRPARRPRRRPVGPALRDDLRRPRSRRDARADRDRRSSRATSRSGRSSSPRSCSRRRRATSCPLTARSCPSLVDRRNVQQANALVQASAQALSIGGWAVAAALLAVLPISTFFAINAGSFFLSALLIARIRRRHTPPASRAGDRGSAAASPLSGCCPRSRSG